MERILELRVDHVSDPERMQQGVPAVETDEPTDVDAEASERQNGNDTDPAPERPCRTPQQRLHQVQREEPEQQGCPRERGEHEAVVPERRRRGVVKVDEVREHVRRVRKEQEPEHAEGRRNQTKPAARARSRTRERTRPEPRPGRDSSPGSDRTNRAGTGFGTPRGRHRTRTQPRAQAARRPR